VRLKLDKITLSEELANDLGNEGIDVQEEIIKYKDGSEKFIRFFVEFKQLTKYLKNQFKILSENKEKLKTIEIDSLLSNFNKKLEELERLNIDEQVNLKIDEKIELRVKSLITENKVESLLNKLVRDCVVEKTKSVENKITKEVNEQINQKVDSIKKLLHFLQKRYKEYDERATKKLNEYSKIMERKHKKLQEKYKSVEKQQNSTKNEDIKELHSENNEDEQELPQTLDID
jgi:hypothetical protein